MPAVLLSDKVSSRLEDLVTHNKHDAAIKELQVALESPCKPAEGEGEYPAGTIVSHQILVKVAKWAAGAETQRQDLQLSSLLRGAQIAVPVKPTPVRVSVPRKM
jgi:hypothetical protein